MPETTKEEKLKTTIEMIHQNENDVICQILDKELSVNPFLFNEEIKSQKQKKK